MPRNTQTLKQMKVKYIDYGIAYSKDGVIYLNINLNKPEYNILKKRIIEHESKHAKGKYDTKDLLLDIDGVENAGYDPLLVKFHLEDIFHSLFRIPPKFPATLWQYSPLDPYGDVQFIPMITWLTVGAALITGFLILP